VGATLMARAGKKGRMLANAASRSARDAFTYDRAFRGIREKVYATEFMERLDGADPDDHYRSAWDAAEGESDTDRALYGDFTTYLPDQLLVKMDVSTMAHSVEARSPLLDTRVLEFAASVPASQLTRGFQTKYLLKRLAERYVPEQVIYRRKRGFVMPASDWLRGSLAKAARGILTSRAASQRQIFKAPQIERMLDEHAAGAADWGNMLWTALVLEIWHLLFVDRTLSRGDSLETLA
jgi:asparagine synthase (glutamine-hydrolysing)